MLMNKGRICLIAWLIAFSCPTEAKEYHLAKVEGTVWQAGMKTK